MSHNNLSDIKKQHVENYLNALLDQIKNNTDVLVDQDITSLLKKPPLDSMDTLRVKLLDLAKKHQIVLNTEKLDELIESYRNVLLKSCDEIKNIRISKLQSFVSKDNLKDDNDMIKINKSEFNSINQKIKKVLKDALVNANDHYICKNINSVFPKDLDENLKKKIIDEYTKYLNGNYKKQLIENFEIKVLVKDTTLLNSIKEQNERYLFTLEHSRVFQDL
ncbi:MAG: hypothetical protein IJG68_06520 [Bacilli bacterium]|nr:hypothetical protein [Bacilli bacterium]